MNDPLGVIERWGRQHAAVMILALILSSFWQHSLPFVLGGSVSMVIFFARLKALWKNSYFLGGPANLVSSLRLLIFNILLLLPIAFPSYLFMGIALCILCLDGVDGFLARKYKTTSLFGEYLDKEIDALFVSGLCLLFYLQQYASGWILWFAGIRYLYILIVFALKPQGMKESRRKWGRVIAVLGMVGLALASAFDRPLAFPLILGVASVITLSFGKSFNQMLRYSPYLSFDQLNAWAQQPLGKSIILGTLLLLLHFLLFLPPYLINIGISTFFPSSDLNMIQEWGNAGAIFLRDNYDIFRFSGDWWLLSIPLLAFQWKPRLKNVCCFILMMIWMLAFYYQLYYAITMKLYAAHPNIIDDWILGKKALPAFLGQVFQGMNRQYYWVILGFILSSWGLGYIVKKSLDFIAEKRANVSHWLLIALIGIGFYYGNKLTEDTIYRKDYRGFQWLSVHIGLSLEKPNTDKIKDLPRVNLYKEWMERDLLRKPDIYLIFLESYGKVLMEVDSISQQYRSQIESTEDSLRKNDWHISSAYSRSPISGGKSWLAFTTVMTGLRLENQTEFDTLVHTHQDYPHLIRYLYGQGYKTFRMKTIENVTAKPLEGEKVTETFYDFMYWYKFPDFPYKGFEYDWFGGIPDQYALNYFKEHLIPHPELPKFLFFITMASHTPWFPPPKLLDDWHYLDTVQQDPYHYPLPPDDMHPYDQFLFKYNSRVKEEISFRHARSVFYDIEMCRDFILKQLNEEDAIVILIGDHQPPALKEGGSPSMDTPVHIISKDSIFVNSFISHGFNTGMWADPDIPAPLQHEGIYSLLMSKLLGTYGKGGEKVTVLPNGL